MYIIVCVYVWCLDLCTVTVIHIYLVLNVQFASSGKANECISNDAWCKSHPNTYSEIFRDSFSVQPVKFREDVLS